MSADLASLLNAFDHGRLSRRQLLKALGIAMAIQPASAFAQGQCGGARAGTPECDPTPAKLPFEPTGWKTVLLDHFSCQVADYPKEAAYYAALMNWKNQERRWQEGSARHRRLGRSRPSRRLRRAAAAAGARLRRRLLRLRGRGGGGPRAPRNAAFDGFCWGIEPWDAKHVESELKKRGLTPVADNDGNDFQSFHIKDPDGFDLQISNGSGKNRRQGAASGKTSAPAPFEATNWKTVWLDHISFEVSNYKETVAFYTALLGWKPGHDEGSQNTCEIGDIGGIIIRRGGGGGRRSCRRRTPPRASRVDGSHLVRHHPVRSGFSEGRARQSAASRRAWTPAAAATSTRRITRAITRRRRTDSTCRSARRHARTAMHRALLRVS